MGAVLVTGASGLVGWPLAAHLAAEHEVVTLSRSAPEIEGTTAIRGDFTAAADLRQLDRFPQSQASLL